MSSQMRQRSAAVEDSRQSKRRTSGANGRRDSEVTIKADYLPHLSGYLVCLYLLLLATMASVSLYFFHWLPAPIVHDDPNDFLVSNARQHLNDITALGFRHVSSDANEIHAKRLIIDKLEAIKSSASEKVEVEISVQEASGHFYLDFLGGMTHIYHNISNVIARFSKRGTSPEHAFMINAHYDSALGSPAASDDAVSCSTMLETLRAISSEPHPLLGDHALIFLFNGAEETILQASHAFVTQHPWAKQIRGFLNLEAAGAGGREIVFQTGPDHPWLAQMYAKVVPHPHASVVAQEIFQSGVIPSDTDFRIFRDYGRFPGIDTAYFVNGYIYHTEYDIPSAIPDGSIQRAGENVMALLKEVVNSHLLSHLEEEDVNGKIVFFDVMGLMMVVYSERLGMVLNLITAAIVLVTVYLGTGKGSHKLLSGKPTLKLVLQSIGYMLLSWVASTIVVIVIALLLLAQGRAMSWFAYPQLIFPLYAVPSFVTVAAVHTYWMQRNANLVSREALEKSSFFATQLVWISLLLLFTALRLCSAFLFLLVCLFPLIFRNFLFDVLISPELRKSSDRSMFGLAYVVSMATCVGLPLMLYIQFHIGIFQMFVPLMGRSGSQLPPDIAIGVLASVCVCTATPHMICVLVYASSGQLKKWCATLLFGTFLAAFAAAAVGYVSTYSVADPNFPVPKRFYLQHTDRTFHALDGSVIRHDSQMFINAFDYLEIQPVADAAPMFRGAKEAECEELYCGEPFYIPVRDRIKRSWYLPAPSLEGLDAAKLKLVSRVTTSSSSTKNLTFQAEFPLRATMFIAPREGYRMTSWSLETYVPPVTACPGKYVNQGCYFVFYSRGFGAGKFTFWVEIEQKGDSVSPFEDSVIEIAVAGHYLDPPHSETARLKELMSSLPGWVSAIGWTSVYSSWIF